MGTSFLKNTVREVFDICVILTYDLVNLGNLGLENGDGISD